MDLENLDFERYTELAKLTDGNKDMPYYYLQLAREAGEVLETFIKSKYHNHEGELDKLELELGDLVWFIAIIADKRGIPLRRIFENNIRKLHKRHPNGYSNDYNNEA